MSAMLLSMSALVAGCVPWPHAVTRSPAITGTITASGRPVAGATVFLAPGAGMPCGKAGSPSTATDDQGRFRVAQVRERRWLRAPLVAPVSVGFYTVCAARDAATIVAWTGLVFPDRENAPVTLDCDLDRPRRLTLPDMSVVDVVCAAPGGK